MVLQKKKIETIKKYQNCTLENRKRQIFGCWSCIVAIVGICRCRACAFVWGLGMYRIHNISHRQRNMWRQLDLGGVPDHSFCCWGCCLTKLSCSAALGLLLSQELWLMETSQKAKCWPDLFLSIQRHRRAEDRSIQITATQYSPSFLHPLWAPGKEKHRISLWNWPYLTLQLCVLSINPICVISWMTSA